MFDPYGAPLLVQEMLRADSLPLLNGRYEPRG